MAQTLYIAIDGDTKGFVSSLKKAENVSVKSGKKMAKGVGAATKAYDLLKGAVVAYLGVQTVRAVVDIADTYSLLESRLKLVTGSTEELTRVQKSLFDISQETRIAYQSTADLYTKVSRATKELGISEERRIDVTRALNKAFIVSGASQEAVKNSTLQLTQALQGGVVRAEEYNSIMENTPRVMEAVADGMGISMGELRKMMLDGKVTSEAFFKAFERGSTEIAKEFSEINATIGQSVTVLKNAFFDIIDNANDTSGATEEIAGSIIELADTITENKEGITSVFVSLIELSGLAVKGVGLLGKSVKGWAMLFEEIGSSLGIVTTEVGGLRAELDKVNGGIDFYSKALEEGRGNTEKIAQTIQQLRARKLELVKALDKIAIGYDEAGNAAEKSGDVQQQVAKDTSDAVKKYSEKELEAYEKAADGITDSWQIAHRERYRIQSRALDAEIQLEEDKNDEIDRNLRDFYAGVEALTREKTDYVAATFVLLFGKIGDTAESELGRIQDQFGDWAESLVTGSFSSIGDAWDSLWKGMLGTVVNTVADMAAEFAVETVVGAFLHDGEMKIKSDEYPAVLQKGEMVIPRREAEQIRGNLDRSTNAHGFKGVVGMSEGLRNALSQPSYSDLVGASLPEALGRFAGKLAGKGYARSTGITAPGFSTAVGMVSAGIMGYLGDRIGDFTNTRNFEAIRDLREDGKIGWTKALAMTPFEAGTGALPDKTGSIFDGVMSIASDIRSGFEGMLSAAGDLLGMGGGDAAASGPGTFGGGPGADLGAAPGGNRQSSGGGYSGPGFGGGGGGTSGGSSGGPSGGIGADGNRDGGYGGLAIGTDYVKKDGLFRLHRGEAVTPASDQKEIIKLLQSLVRGVASGGNGQAVNVNVYLGKQKLNSLVESIVVERNRRGVRPTERAYVAG